MVDGIYRLPPKELLAAREEAFDFLAAFCTTSLTFNDELDLTSFSSSGL